MAMPISIQTRYWGLAALLFVVMLWTMGNVLLPFLAGAAVAYFLDPLVNRLEALGLSRALATTLITLIALLGVVLLALAIMPMLIEQIIALATATPDLLAGLQSFLIERFPDLADSSSVLRKMLASMGDTLREGGGEFALTLATSAGGIMSAIIFVVVTPVVAFYLLLDWRRLIARVDHLLPREHAATIRRLARESDRALAGFVRGQLSVCVLLGAFYAVALVIAGLKYGLAVGAIAGAITFIPYLGTLVGGTLAIGLALFQFWGDWVQVGIIVAIFAIGQFVEGNILTPKLVGRSVGLHPVWLLLALAAFGSLFGFAGMLVAVPLAAVIGVLVRFAIARYEESALYTGGATGDGGGGGGTGNDAP